ncbi:hypothetical protein G7046_g4850 [Stylonectria norvegica]|nr:hypothetical protein G7046_g4850 [Stylonectria norvegica]
MADNYYYEEEYSRRRPRDQRDQSPEYYSGGAPRNDRNDGPPPPPPGPPGPPPPPGATPFASTTRLDEEAYGPPYDPSALRPSSQHRNCPTQPRPFPCPIRLRL